MGPMPTAAVGESTPLNHSAEVTPEKATVTYTRVKDACSGGAKAVGIIRVKEMPGNCDSLPTESQYGSSESVTKSVSEYRNGSAKSCDSGLGRDNTDIIITENSSETMKDNARVPEDVSEPNLTIDGKHLKTPGPMGHRKRTTVRLPPVHPNSQHRLEETTLNIKNEIDDLEAILQKRVQFADVLINELPCTASITKRPVSRGGVAFDITSFREEASGGRSNTRRPACVLQYAQQRRAAELVTHVELDEKQKAADLRRKVGQCGMKVPYIKACSQALWSYIIFPRSLASGPGFKANPT